VLVNSATTLKADALQTGNGGEVVLWSDQSMRFTGNISAKGGALSGNGGNAEVSGLTSFGYGGLTDLSAANGLNGTLLLDPNNITIVAGAGLPYQEIFDPTPGAGEGFGGAQNLELYNGNILITSPNDSLAGLNSGAAYLYTPAGSLVSALTGSAAGDQVGSSITHLANDNIIVSSLNWGSGGVAANALGAVTWMNGLTGKLSDGATGGSVLASNSLVGGAVGDTVGSGGITVLTDNSTFWNVAVRSDQWGSAGVASAGLGAVTWMNGSNGLLSDGVSAGGAVAASNSLVGSTTGDGAWVVVTGLSNGNAAVSMPLWDNATTVDAGAVTWMNGSTGKLADGSLGKAVSASISLVGGATSDRIGYNGITPLSNGNYVVSSMTWGSGGLFGGPGAVTWVSGSNGNTVNGGSYGAVVSSANSLVGSGPTDYVGQWSVTELLGNGNFVVNTPSWGSSGGAGTGFGAATWMNGKTGALIGGTAFGGAISSANSLVGAAAGDQAGSNVIRLTNGNYLLTDFNYNYNSVTGTGAGAVVFGNGTSGVAGTVSATNSLVGSLSTDQIGWMGYGASIDILPNGNYLVRSPSWNNNAGAVTFGDGKIGTVGLVSASNSLIGSTGGTSTTGDRVGNSPVTLLPGSNYVVTSSAWTDFGGVLHVGAVTWGNGTTGTVGAISSANSLVGSTANDQVGYYGVTVLGNGNYVVNSPYWSNGAATSAGAVTWVNGTNGNIAGSISPGGVVSTANSLVGTTSSDDVGIGGVTLLSNGNYVVNSYYWNNGLATQAGAVTWVNGTNGNIAGSAAPGGFVSMSNSLVGTAASDWVGMYGITQLVGNSNYVVQSSAWNGGFGAVTWGDGSVGTIGAVSTANSLVGSTVGDNIGNSVVALSNGNYVVSSYGWNGGFGAVTWGNGLSGTVGAVTAANSLIGSTVFDNVGSGGGIGNNIIELAGNGNFVITNYSWGSAGGYGDGKGAVTWMNGTNGKLADGTSGGAISATNSLVGSTLGDLVGSSCDCSSSGYVISLSNGNYAVISPSWTNGLLSGAGAATLGNGAAGTVGTVSASNSLVGTAASEHLGSGAFELIGQPDRVLIANAAANNGYGGVYLFGGSATLVNGTLLFTDNPGTDSTIGAALIDSTLNAGTNVVLQANNDITQSAGAAINATGKGSLTLQAGHSVVLNDTININGALDITANDPGAILPGTGVLDTSKATLTASQVSLINYAGDVAIGIIHGGAGAVTVVATGGNFINNSGSTTPITTTGLASVYSTDPALDALKGMGSNFHRYNCTYALGCAPTTVIPSTGIGFFYPIAPMLTITANAATKTYGTLDASALTYSATGFVTAAGDTSANVLTGSLSHTGPEDVNPTPYPITIGTLGTLANQMGYGITFIPTGTLTITPATLTIAANATSKILNTADPLLTYSVSGLQFTDTAATTLTGSLSRTTGETVGIYQINQGSLNLFAAGLVNYTLNYVAANFTILVPTVINEIVDISNQKRKKIEDVLASNTPAADGGNTQGLPMCN